MPGAVGAGYETDPSRSMEEHIRELWPVLTRQPDDADAVTSLIPLAEPLRRPRRPFP